MALSVSGRVQAASLGLAGTPICIVQDWDDLDTFYFVVQGATWKVYKFTWPGTLVEIADIGAWAGKDAWKAAFDYDFNYVWGVQDATKHYAIAIGPTGPHQAGGTGIFTIVDVNLETGAFTSYSPSMAALGGFDYRFYNLALYSFSDSQGTHFYAAFGAEIVTKRYGQAVGTYLSTGMGNYIAQIDDQNFAAGRTYKVTPVGIGGSVNVGAWIPTTIAGVTSLYYTSEGSNRGLPQKDLQWGNWRYFLATAYMSAGGDNHLMFFRKNVVTGQYSYVDLGDHNRDNPGVYDSFDLGEIGSTLRAYFVNAYRRYRAYGCPLWPPDANTYLDVDDTNTIINALYTNPADAAIYAFHYGGVYAACITKIADTELVTEPDASPSVSATGAKVLWKDKRVFFIKVPGYGRHLWWGAPFEPQSLDPSWDGYNTPVFENEDNTALQVYGDMVYIGSRAGWKRLRGKTPDYWVLDDIDGAEGPITDKAVAVTPHGAIYPREDGLYLFNGYSTRLFYLQGKPILENVNWDAIEKAFSVYDGRYFRFFYPSGGATQNDRELVVDLIGGLENARATETDRAASAGYYDPVTKILFLGDEDGNLLVDGSSGSRTLTVTTKEFPANQLLRAGTFSKLHYDADTQGETITVTPYYDGVAKAPVAITTNGRKRGSVSLPDGNAYRVGIKLSITTDKDVKIYEPWVLE